MDKQKAHDRKLEAEIRDVNRAAAEEATTFAAKAVLIGVVVIFGLILL